MTSKTIYQPFTYCITFILTGQRYYGSRYSEREIAHPDQLWTTYFTSSEVIKDLIEEHGEDSFTYQVRKIFATKKETVAWETRFLTRINAAKSLDWLNGHNGSATFHSTPESVQKAKDTRKRNGTKHPMKNPETIQKAKDTKIKNGTTIFITPESIQKGLKTRKKNGTLNPSNAKSIQKTKDTKIKNGTTNPNTLESIQKAKDTRERNGTTNPMKNPETIQKAKDTRERNNIVSPAKIPFFSIIESKKTYAKNVLSRLYPGLKQYY